MKILETNFSIDSFFDDLMGCDSPLLMLDYDGTLAPFKSERADAVPYDGIRNILNKLLKKSRTRLVIVTGRECRDMVQMIGLDHPIEIWGMHGGERLHPDGRFETKAVNENQRRGLKQIDAWTTENHLSQFCEQKAISRAFHFRGIDSTIELKTRSSIEAGWRESAGQYELALHDFDGGLEIRPVGISKAGVVRTVRAESEQTVVAAFMGDDYTDEDAFCSLRSNDLPVLVRNEFRPTAARLWLHPPEDLINFLERWESLTRN